LRKWLREWSAELPVVFYTRHADHPDKIKQILAVGATYKDIFSKQDTAKDIHSILQRFQQLWMTVDVTTPDENEIGLEVSEAPTVAEVGKWLREFTATTQNPEDWEFVRTLPSFGEIRTPDHWRNLPRDCEIRVTLLRDSYGLVLRWWYDNQLIKLLNSTPFDDKEKRRELHSRIITHEHLATYKPQTLSELRSGYVKLTKDNELVVYGDKGSTKFRLPPEENVGI
jgi:hypothetical protein